MYITSEACTLALACPQVVSYCKFVTKELITIAIAGKHEMKQAFLSVRATALGIVLAQFLSATKDREKELLFRRQDPSLPNIHSRKYSIASGSSATSTAR